MQPKINIYFACKLCISFLLYAQLGFNFMINEPKSRKNYSVNYRECVAVSNGIFNQMQIYKS